jgi:antitoxin (DNA-binding transcriptional repressor) of toxin-antitoxin stability system
VKTATVQDLRTRFSMLEAWLAEGEVIQIEKRGRPIGVLRGYKVDSCPAVRKPDFAARRKAIWGERVLTDAEVASMRAEELDGEEG